MKTEVLMQKTHRFGYDRAVRNTGVRIVEFETAAEAERLAGPQTVAVIFDKSSTRTRVSFEIAGLWMSADTVNVSASGSSVASLTMIVPTALPPEVSAVPALSSFRLTGTIATSDWPELEKHRAEYRALGVDIDRTCRRTDQRHYPFGGLMFDLLGDLYVIPIGGGEARAITTGMAWDMHPAYSPNGRWIAFTSDRTGRNIKEIFLMDYDGANQRRISSQVSRDGNQWWIACAESVAAAATLCREKGCDGLIALAIDQQAFPDPEDAEPGHARPDDVEPGRDPGRVAGHERDHRSGRAAERPGRRRSPAGRRPGAPRRPARRLRRARRRTA